mgnify:CR=1 FL=1
MLFLVVCWSFVAGFSGILSDFVALSITSKKYVCKSTKIFCLGCLCLSEEMANKPQRELSA